ncbi:hypothetical protein C1H46_000612 [Malus baccata]|uniref:Uncharacterized protein n=1 Tax=Malus baccata TaxID=106549 RepID=A0A540NRH3_MALBA|nr:hypothetical protein C1H46_000612 [Malus baccata]
MNKVKRAHQMYQEIKKSRIHEGSLECTTGGDFVTSSSFALASTHDGGSGSISLHVDGKWNNADATEVGVTSSRGRKWPKEPGLACCLFFDSVGKKVSNNIISIPICLFPHS